MFVVPPFVTDNSNTLNPIFGYLPRFSFVPVSSVIVTGFKRMQYIVDDAFCVV